MVAEVEFASETTSRRFQMPPWFGKEVTGKKMYSNAQIAKVGWKRSG
jgi:CYTH domain-containing protein